jgi:hypothetical protein
MDTNGEARLAIETQLARGEHLIWTGRPRGGVRLQAADALMIPFSLFWAGFAVFWEMSVIGSGAPFFFVLWGIPFLLMGAYIVVGRFFFDAWRRRRTAYGLTDQRAIIVSGVFNREVKSLALRTLAEVSLSERSDRSGTITFGSTAGMAGWLGGTSWPSRGRYQPPAFEMIPDARYVYEQMREAQQAAVGASSAVAP